MIAWMCPFCFAFFVKRHSNNQVNTWCIDDNNMESDTQEVITLYNM